VFIAVAPEVPIFEDSQESFTVQACSSQPHENSLCKQADSYNYIGWLTSPQVALPSALNRVLPRSLASAALR